MNKVIFLSKEVAEKKTGYFSVDSILITRSLYKKIAEYTRKNQLETWHGSNQAGTCHNTHTLNFTLKYYHNFSSKPKIYISNRGALGPYNKMYKEYPESAPISLEKLQEKSPTIEDMYFWIARKYPKDILWMKYSFE